MDIIPEAVILVLAPVAAFILMGIKQAAGQGVDRMAILLAIVVGIVLAGAVYAAGIVETDGMNGTKVVGRAVLAGVVIAMAAYRLPDTVRTLRRGHDVG